MFVPEPKFEIGDYLVLNRTDPVIAMALECEWELPAEERLSAFGGGNVLRIEVTEIEFLEDEFLYQLTDRGSTVWIAEDFLVKPSHIQQFHDHVLGTIDQIAADLPVVLTVEIEGQPFNVKLFPGHDNLFDHDRPSLRKLL